MSARPILGRSPALLLAQFAALVRDAEAVGRALGTNELPEALGELRRVDARLTARLYSPPTSSPAGAGPDQLLTAEETAEKLSLSTDTVYRNASSYPFTVRQGRALRFSSRGVDDYIKSCQGKPRR